MVIMYANCKIYWCSLLKMEIALSSSEDEYIAISSALREVLPLMKTTEEINEVFPLHIPKPNIFASSMKITNPVLKWPPGKKYLPEQSTLPLHNITS